MSTKMHVIICLFLINIIIVSGLTCDEILEFPEDKKLSQQELESMQPKDIVQCLVHLGREELPRPEAEFIWKSIIKYHEGIENVPDKVLSVLHWVTVAITPEEYANLSLSNIDIVQNFGLNYNLNEAQLSAIANRVREDFAGKEPEDYTYYDLTAIRQILCLFNKSEIERVPPSSYREAALLIGKLHNCRAEAMSTFATLAVQKRAFGPLSDWTADIIKIIGEVANYLPKELINKFGINPNPVSNVSTVAM